MADNIPALPAGFVPMDDAGPALPAGFQEMSTKGKHLTFEEGQRLLDKEDQSGVSGAFGAATTGFLNGLPLVGPAVLDGTERIGAGITTAINGDGYDENLDRVRQLTDDAQEAHPIVTTGAEIAGGVTGSLPMMAAAPAAFGMGNAGVAARVATGIAGQVPLGAADGYIRNGAEGAAWGGGAGLVSGALGPVVGNLASKGFRAVAESRALSEAAKLAGTSKPSVDVVARALGADGAAGATNANILAAGPQAMLADAGPSTLSVLDTAIQRGGPQAGSAGQRVSARAAQSTQDINAALDAGLGAPEGIVKPLTALREQTQPARKAAYDAAYSKPIDYADPRGQALEKMVKTRVPGSAINRANELMRVNGEESQQIMARVADDGTVTFETLPDVRQLDYITRGLKDVAAEADGKGKLGGQTDIGRAYAGLSREIRNMAKALVPEYKVALDTAAAPIAERESKLFGQTMLSPSVARDEVEEFVSGLSGAELKSLRGGLRSKFAETIANVKRTATDPNIDARQGVSALKELSSDAAREKLASVMGKAEADSMFKAVDQAAKSFEIRAGVATNSKTYSRQAAERAVDEATAPGIAEAAASGKPIVTAQSFLQGLMGAGKADQLARQDGVWGEVANLLTQPAGQSGGTFLQAMQSAAGKLPAIDRRALGISSGVTRGNAIVSRPFGTQLAEPRKQ